MVPSRQRTLERAAPQRIALRRGAAGYNTGANARACMTCANRRPIAHA